jgi:SulP family sulfate permease
VVILRPYGSLFFASAGTFEDALPNIGPETEDSVVIITLRGKEDLGSTFINVITQYATRLDNADCLLKISGVSEHIKRQMDATGATEIVGPANIYPMTPTLAESTLAAKRDAEQWVTQITEPPQPESTDSARRVGGGRLFRRVVSWGRNRLHRGE